MGVADNATPLNIMTALPTNIRLKDYSRYIEALAFGDLFCTMNKWEVVDVEILADERFARVILWHYKREFKLLMRSTDKIACTWMGDYWIQIEKP